MRLTELTRTVHDAHAGKPTTLESPWGPVTVTVDPSGLTAAALLDVAADYRAAAGDPVAQQFAAVNTMVESCASLLEAWDLTDDDGQPVPVTRETLAALPVVFLGWLANAMQEAAAADPFPSAPAADGSPPAA